MGVGHFFLERLEQAALPKVLRYVNGARFGWREPVIGQPGVLTPEQAVAAAVILGARVLVPIHYGISGMDKYVEVDDPLGRARRAARERDVPLQIMEPGTWLQWPEGSL